jgi:hypothetical protein
MSKRNGRPGRKDEKIAALNRVIEEQRAEIERLKGGGEPNAYTAPAGKVRRRQIRARAYDLYRALGGDVIDQQLRNAGFKARAFAVQMRAAETGQSELVYGPDITVYEDRMSGGLVARLMKLKQALLKQCQEEAKMDAEECEALGADFEQDEPDPVVLNHQRRVTRPAAPPPDIRLDFSDEEVAAMLAWLSGDRSGQRPAAADEINEAMKHILHNPQHATPALIKLLEEAEKLDQRMDEEDARARANAPGNHRHAS